MSKMRMLDCVSYMIPYSSGRPWIKLALVTREQNQERMRPREGQFLFEGQKFRISPDQERYTCPCWAAHEFCVPKRKQG